MNDPQHEQFARACTPATELRGDELRHALSAASDEALKRGEPATLVGVLNGDVGVCIGGCCARRPGAAVVVPDVIVAQIAANGGGTPPDDTMTLEREDGRSVTVFETIPTT